MKIQDAFKRTDKYLYKKIKRKKNSIMSFLELPHNFIHFIKPFNVILILKH